MEKHYETVQMVAAQEKGIFVVNSDFTVWLDVDGLQVLLGPKQADDRTFKIHSARVARRFVFKHKEHGKVFFDKQTLPSPVEVLDPTPVEVPIRHRGPTPLREQIKELLQRELYVRAVNEGYETEAESDDFDVSDEDLDDMLSPYELRPMQEEALLDAEPSGDPTPQDPPAKPVVDPAKPA